MADIHLAESVKSQYGAEAVYHVLNQPNSVTRNIREKYGKEVVETIRTKLLEAGMIEIKPRRQIGRFEAGRRFYEKLQYARSTAGTVWSHQLQKEQQTENG